MRNSAATKVIQGNFYKARHFIVQDSSFGSNLHSSENCELLFTVARLALHYSCPLVMEKIAGKTIPGAAFDSSERDSPPRCHPKTRLTIVERAKGFFANQHDKKMMWLVVVAGLGKSAIMQTLAEIPPTPDFTLGASLFFSVNGRNDGSKAIATLAYQLAVRSQEYREFIRDEVDRDPLLPEKAITQQFGKFIIEPFITHHVHPEGHKQFLILIDGLDECNDQRAQCMILELISTFCIKYPNSPLLWVIASRPEPHITRFMSRLDIIPSYIKEKVEVDTDESRNDVERYLRHEMENIRVKYPGLDFSSRWPKEYDFLRVTTTAKGLFAYGAAVVKYVDDPIYAHPESRLQEVLDVIDDTRSQATGEEGHPMADLDALYARVISQVHPATLDNTKNLLLLFLWGPSFSYHFSYLPLCCNWLGMTPGTAFSSLHHLYSVLDIPSVNDAYDLPVSFHHKSFRDYLSDPNRSGIFLDFQEEGEKLGLQCVLRVLNEMSKGLCITVLLVSPG